MKAVFQQVALREPVEGNCLFDTFRRVPVRHAIYMDAVNRFEKYQEHIGPLLQAMGRARAPKPEET